MARYRFLCTLLVIFPATSKCPGAPPGEKPVLTPVWKVSTVGIPKDEDFGGTRNETAIQWLTAYYQSVVTELHAGNRPIIPPAVPLASKDRVIYPDDVGISVRALFHGTLFGERVKAGELLWRSESDTGLLTMARDLVGRWQIETWLKDEKVLSSRFLYRTLYHRPWVHKNIVGYVDDAGLLPGRREHNARAGAGALSDRISTTALRECDLDGGLLLRVFGNRTFGRSQGTNFFILGRPFPLDDDRIILRERGRTLTLLRLDLPKYAAEHLTNGPDRGIEVGRKWEVDLVQPPMPLREDTHRRIHAVELVDAAGLIIAPTNVGRVVAVDRDLGKIRWTHQYAPLDAKRFPTFAPEWVVVPPVVVNDRYVYAPADFPELLCLNVVDGKKCWSVRKGDGLYPAVVGEQVLIIGEKFLRSLDLKDGSERWKVDLPGLPCGRGAMLGEHFLLPFSEPKTWKGMIARVNVKSGKIDEVIKSEQDQPIGNLVVHQDFLISQTLTDLAVFPIR